MNLVWFLCALLKFVTGYFKPRKMRRETDLNNIEQILIVNAWDNWQFHFHIELILPLVPAVIPIKGRNDKNVGNIKHYVHSMSQCSLGSCKNLNITLKILFP